jgi:hypothetical protein
VSAPQRGIGDSGGRGSGRQLGAFGGGPGGASGPCGPGPGADSEATADRPPSPSQAATGSGGEWALHTGPRSVEVAELQPTLLTLGLGRCYASGPLPAAARRRREPTGILLSVDDRKTNLLDTQFKATTLSPTFQDSSSARIQQMPTRSRHEGDETS